MSDAERTLARVPVQSSYNLTVLDRSGTAATVWVGPDHAPATAPTAAATNHQASVEWIEYACWTRTLERGARLEQLLAHAGASDGEEIIDAFLPPPLRAVGYARGLGTLYTAIMRPGVGSIEYRWPCSTWRHRLARPRSGAHTVILADALAA